MTDRDALLDVAHRMAAAIGRRDLAAVRALLARGFVQRTIGGAAVDAAQFLDNLQRIPGTIVSVEVTGVEVDLGDGVALVTGMQHARLLLDGEMVDDTRPFVDWMIKEDGAWRFRAAIDMPA